MHTPHTILEVILEKSEAHVCTAHLVLKCNFKEFKEIP